MPIKLVIAMAEAAYTKSTNRASIVTASLLDNVDLQCCTSQVCCVAYRSNANKGFALQSHQLLFATEQALLALQLQKKAC